ncbi:MAG: hypothetical protein OEZ06_01970 [Myxococcales bacterium]|nr:hypothetical protein [Myxococcales bacterium]
MDSTQRFAVESPGEQVAVASPVVMVGAALLAACIGYVVLLAQPAAVAAAVLRLRELAPGNAWLAPVLVGALGILASGLGIYGLSRFVMGVREAPYLWLAPLLVFLAGAVVGGSDEPLALPGHSARSFVLPALLLVLAGGALIQQRTWRARLLGLLLWLLPMAALTLAFAVVPGAWPGSFGALAPGQQLVLYMLVSTWLALLAMALYLPAGHGRQGWARAQQDLGALRLALREGEQKLRQERQALVQSQQRGQQLERALAHAQQQLSEVELVRPQGLALWVKLGLCALLLGALVIGVELGVRRPLVAQLSAERLALMQAEEGHRRALSALGDSERVHRADLEAQLLQSSQQLTAAREQLAVLSAEKQARELEQVAESETEEEAVAVAAVPKKQQQPQLRRSAKNSSKTSAKTRVQRKARARNPQARRGGDSDALTAGGDDPIAGL